MEADICPKRGNNKELNLFLECIYRIPIPRRQLQLLGCVCLMLESQRPPSPFEYSMKTSDVVYICDSQYDEQQVEQMRKVVVTSTFHKRIRTPPTTFCFLCQFLSMIHQPGFHRSANFSAHIDLYEHYMTMYLLCILCVGKHWLNLVMGLSTLSCQYFSLTYLS
mmetsp:Transcript_28211/g.35418  ORF Transcript_28211/g.35418 Transcript_28211/m.35418 type:complete len:164 (+) Transcript_28211:966-1457(+)